MKEGNEMKIKGILCSFLVCLCLLSGCSGQLEPQPSDKSRTTTSTDANDAKTQLTTVTKKISSPTTKATTTKATTTTAITMTEAQDSYIQNNNVQVGDVIFEGAGVKVTLKGIEDDKYDKVVVFNVENNSTKNVHILLVSTAVNDYMIESFASSVDNIVLPGKKGRSTYEFDKEILSETGISIIETVSGVLYVELIDEGSDSIEDKYNFIAEYNLTMNF